jgi:hypothetical protein
MDPHDPRTWHWPLGMPETLAKTEVRMAVKTLNIRKNADNTLTVSANNYKESIGLEDKSEQEIYESVKFAIICANFDWNNETADLVRSELEKI